MWCHPPRHALTAHDRFQSTEPHTGFAGEILGLAVEPLPGAIDELPRAIDVDAGRTSDLVDVDLLEMLDGTNEVRP